MLEELVYIIMVATGCRELIDSMIENKGIMFEIVETLLLLLLYVNISYVVPNIFYNNNTVRKRMNKVSATYTSLSCH
jgi:hypothetical protein